MIRAPALAAIALLAACEMDLGETGEWVFIEDLEPGLMAEKDAPPQGAMSAVSTSPGNHRVVSYNVKLGERAEDIASALLANPEVGQPAILMLQEEEYHPNEERSRTRRLAEALGMGWVYVPARHKGDGTHGLALLSPYPITNVMRMALPQSETGHPRAAMQADVVVNGTPIRVINVHLATLVNISDRILQLRPAIIDAPETVIVGGDFNTNPYIWSDTGIPNAPAHAIADTDQAPLLDDYMRHLGFDTPTAELGATETMFGIESRLDSIFVRNLDSMPGGVERDITLSDHWPLWIDIGLR
jgi:endonuclease/exonuclease/phosphatase family metal-dependent hydrolase